MTFPVIPAKAGIQVPLEADIVLVRDSGLRRNDEIGLLNCLIIKCQHYLVRRHLWKASHRVFRLSEEQAGQPVNWSPLPQGEAGVRVNNVASLAPCPIIERPWASLGSLWRKTEASPPEAVSQVTEIVRFGRRIPTFTASMRSLQSNCDCSSRKRREVQNSISKSFVTPAKAGVQYAGRSCQAVDSRFRGK